jgi:iron complex outermembrane receptor protein
MERTINLHDRQGRHLRRKGVIGTVSSLALVAAFAASGASPALAQDDAVLDTITVTAQFRTQNLQQTPVAITAFNAETMEARSQTSIEQVAVNAPSVTLAPRGGAYGPSMAISIRGVGQSDFNPAYEPGVGIYIDDVYFPTLTGSIMDLLDLDRVEISRGPQGTLAGRNSIGGAVKLYSKEPVGDNTGYALVTYGSRDRVDLRASADFAIADNLFARISGVSKKQDGYVKRLDYGCMFPDSGIPRNMSSNTDCVMAREGEVNYDALRGILRWDNDGPVTVTIIGDYTDDNRTTAPSVLVAANYDPAGNTDVDPWNSGLTLADFVPPAGSYYNYGTYIMGETPNRPSRYTEGRSFFRSWGVSGKIDWDINDTMQLESITAYRDYNSGFQNDNDLSPFYQQIGDGTQPFWGFSQELRLNGAFGADKQVEWTIGGFYMDQRSWYPSYQDLRYSTLVPFQQNDPIDADSKAAFAHVNWIATDQLTLVGGIRYTDESKDYQFSRRAPDGGVLGGPLAVLDTKVGHYSGNKIDWRLGVQYQWTDALMTYAQVATGFKGGGVNPRPFYPEQAVGFGPESLVSYEAGVKSELLNRTLRFNAAVFYSDYKDIQTGATTCPPEFVMSGPICSLTVNAGKAEVKGVELETNFEPVENLLFDGSLSYLDFQYSKVSELAQGGAIAVGNTAPFTPKWKWSLGAQYSLWLDDNQSITPRFDISYTGSQFVSSSNLARSEIENYVLANARLTYRNEDRGWEAALEVTNIFDKYYFRGFYDAYDRAGLISGTPGHPREWAVTLKKTF